MHRSVFFFLSLLSSLFFGASALAQSNLPAQKPEISFKVSDSSLADTYRLVYSEGPRIIIPKIEGQPSHIVNRINSGLFGADSLEAADGSDLNQIVYLVKEGVSLVAFVKDDTREMTIRLEENSDGSLEGKARFGNNPAWDTPEGALFSLRIRIVPTKIDDDWKPVVTVFTTLARRTAGASERSVSPERTSTLMRGQDVHCDETAESEEGG